MKEINKIISDELGCIDYASNLQLMRRFINTGLIEFDKDDDLHILCKKWEEINIKRIKDKNYPKKIEEAIFNAQRKIEEKLEKSMKEDADNFMVGDGLDKRPKGLFTSDSEDKFVVFPNPQKDFPILLD